MQKERRRERRHGDVRHRIGGVLPRTPVWEALKALPEAAEPSAQALHQGVDRTAYRFRNPRSPGPAVLSRRGNSDSLPAQSAGHRLSARSLHLLDQLLQRPLVRIENRWGGIDPHDRQGDRWQSDSVGNCSL